MVIPAWIITSARGPALFAALLIVGAVASVAGPNMPSFGTATTEQSGSGQADRWRDAYRRPKTIPYPETNPFSPEKARLGEALFFETRLSKSQTLSCASCHNPALAWGDGLARAKGEGVTPSDFRSPTLLDVAWLDRLGWDGRFRDLESVTFAPILSPCLLSMTEKSLYERLDAEPAYVAAFADAFPDKAINKRNIEQALATYERSIVSSVAPFDRWIDGDEGAIGDAAKRGFALFDGKANCSQCHSGWAFTDGSFHDIGFAKDDDLGRGRYFPTSVMLQHAFKTPTLREVARRAHYMHNGSIQTLSAVVDFYNDGGIDRPSRARSVKPLKLSAMEKSDLIAFLKTLSSESSF